MKLSDLSEVKKSKGRTQVPVVVAEPEKKSVAVERCPLFLDSYIEKVRSNKVLLNKIATFLRKKVEDPLIPVGNDRPLLSKGPYGSMVPGIWHAHLNLDISIWYVYVGGSNPTLKLYGVFTHEETGTGQPAKIQKQQTMAAKMANQKEFTPFSITQ